MRAKSLVPSCLVLSGAVGALALWAAIAYRLGEGTDRQFLKNYREPNDYEAQIDITMGYAAGSSEANEVVFLGDSTCYAAVRPVAFEALTGLRAYNLSTVGVVGVDGLQLVLRTYLEHHPDPRLVVFCLHPWELGVDPTATGPAWVREQFLVSYAGVPRRALHSAWPVARHYVRQGFWSAYGEATGGVERRALLPIPRRGGQTLETLTRLVRSNRGFEEQAGEMDPSLRPREAVGPFPVLAAAATGVDEIIRLASAHGARVLVRLTPALTGGPDPEERMVHDWISGVAGRYPALLVGRPEVLRYEPTEFSERLHLNARGATRFTADVAQEAVRGLGLERTSKDASGKSTREAE